MLIAACRSSLAKIAIAQHRTKQNKRTRRETKQDKIWQIYFIHLIIWFATVLVSMGQTSKTFKMKWEEEEGEEEKHNKQMKSNVSCINDSIIWFFKHW